jgi:hypothetical protein
MEGGEWKNVQGALTGTYAGQSDEPTGVNRITLTTGVNLAEQDFLQLVVEGEHTSTGNTTEDIGTCSLEQGLCAFLGNDLE